MEHWFGFVNRGEPDACWLWNGARDAKGYGLYKARSATRAYFRLMGNPVDAELVVRHTCDNPPCCNPAHLITGTQKQNAQDRTERGRTGYRARGEAHNNCKLTDTKVVEMRNERRAGASLKSLSIKYGLTQTNCRKACAGETWAHIPNPVVEKVNCCKRTNEDTVREIRILRGFDFELREISDMVDVKLSTVFNIVNGDTWKYVK